MRLAVTANEPGLVTSVAGRLEEARYLIIFDTDTHHFEAHDMETDGDVPAFDALIAGGIGRSALHAYLAGGVVVHLDPGNSVAEAIEAYTENRLPCAVEV